MPTFSLLGRDQGPKQLMNQIRSANTEQQAGQDGALSPVFVAAVCDRLRSDGSISAQDVRAVLAAARDERALRAALDQPDEGPDLAPALNLLRERGFSRTAETVHDITVKMKRELAEARAALVAAEARAAGKPAPLGNGEFLSWWNNAGKELLVDVSVHDAALIFHAGADRVLQQGSNHLDDWMVRAAMRNALPYLQREASAQPLRRDAVRERPFEGAGFAAQTFRQVLGDGEEAGQAVETALATETTAEPDRKKHQPRRVQQEKRRFGLRLFPA
jgi:hypothetical protein